MINKTRLYIVRHGQSEFNLKHILQGQLNSKLSELGVNQAYQVKKYLKRINFDVAYSSDLDRAYKTGQIILEDRGMKIHKSKNLRERDYGSLDGMSTKEFRAKGYFTGDISAFGGESERDLAKRSIKEFTRIAEKEKGKKVLITTHETMIMYLLKQIDPEGLKEYRDGDKLVANCSTTVLDYKDGKFKIVKMAYADYMKNATL